MVNLGVAIALVVLTAAGAKKPAAVLQAAPSSPKPASTRTVEGRFVRYLESPDGKIDGVVLKDGTVARFTARPRALEPTLLRNGDTVRVQGDLVRGLPGPYLVHASLSRADALKAKGSQADRPRAMSNVGKGAVLSTAMPNQADEVLFVESPRLAHKPNRLRATENQLKRLTTDKHRHAVDSRWSRRQEDEGP